MQQNERISIFIDNVEYKVPKNQSATGRELRGLRNPPIGTDLDLFQEVPGPDDPKIEMQQEVPLVDGMRFYTAPTTINPGA